MMPTPSIECLRAMRVSHDINILHVGRRYCCHCVGRDRAGYERIREGTTLVLVPRRRLHQLITTLQRIAQGLCCL